MTSFGLTIFLSAFLLFQVQPLIGKAILPWFGGSPAVWTVCLLFFQVALLGGYGYAHWIAGFRRRRQQIVVHLLLLAGTLFFLPLLPSEAWKPAGGESPLWRILALLTVTVGAPYFVLSTTGPLLQAWFRVTHADRSPYRLYALSNAGSLLGLLTYPFLFEPLLKVQTQAVVWSGAYVVFLLSCIPCVVLLARATPRTGSGRGGERGGETPGGDPGLAGASPPGLKNALLWVALAAGGSVLLLATTNQMCETLAVVPFLWVMPLSLYLLTFILTFESDRRYRRWWAVPLLAVTGCGAGWVLHHPFDAPLTLQIALYAAALFAGCMVFHGELARAKPPQRWLTHFYLSVAFGGAVGGVLVAVAAPLLLSGYWEYHLALGSAAAVAAAVLYFSPPSPWHRGRRPALWVPVLLVCGGLFTVLVSAVRKELSGALAMTRSFYGVLKVSESADLYDRSYRELYHGMVVHGIQYQDPAWRTRPAGYYGPESGAWLAMRNHPRRLAGEPMRIGVVGLGAGALAAFGEEGDELWFYELNPDVIALSEEWFSYRSDTPAAVKIALGDARLRIEEEPERKEEDRFDVLFIDAFTGGSVPLHLLTVECASIYRRQLKSDGILAVNISNRNLGLAPVAFGMARHLGWEGVNLYTWGDPEKGSFDVQWVLITANEEFLDSPALLQAQEDWGVDPVDPLKWTDDYASLLHVLKR